MPKNIDTLVYWMKVLDARTPWATAYPIVAQVAQHYLDANVIQPNEITATELARLAFAPLFVKPLPLAVNANAVQACKLRLFQALRANAQHDLASYARKGEKAISTFNGKPTSVYWWSAPGHDF